MLRIVLYACLSAAQSGGIKFPSIGVLLSIPYFLDLYTQ